MAFIFPAILIGIIVGVTILASNEGAWGAALICVSTVFAGLIAMNFFEPVAVALEPMLFDYADYLALVGLFALSVTIIRFIADYLAPTSIELPALVYDGGRFGFGLIAGYVTMAFLCTATHTAPIPREAIGFKPEDKMLIAFAPDRQWLGFTQWFSERVMGSQNVFDGPQFKGIPGTEKYFSTQPPRWPSFILRYAARREAYGRGGRPAAPGVGAPAAGTPNAGGQKPPASTSF